MFITFEGPDGSGKTTQVQQTAVYLRAQGYDVLLTREPGGTAIGDHIREVLHSLAHKAMHPRAELLLYNASRAQLVEEVIRPHLTRGGLVICDRFYDSTLAYQGYGHGLDLDILRTIIAFATDGLRPNLTIYLDIAPEDGLQRRLSALAQGEEWNRLDDMEMAFHRRVREGYHKLIAAEPDRWVCINGAQPMERVQADILAALERRLK
ncbi:dTMP kinase [Elioraea sp.]|uniref:dTMP kinase n=1 Tax=Elioraea sp. TaxID=2185103 RepID=UPI00307D379D